MAGEAAVEVSVDGSESSTDGQKRGRAYHHFRRIASTQKRRGLQVSLPLACVYLVLLIVCFFLALVFAALWILLITIPFIILFGGLTLYFWIAFWCVLFEGSGFFGNPDGWSSEEED
jgi:Flp pilus assembly protein TadB